jgi:hypothetical protein
MDSVQEWQQRFDEDFPRGALVAFEWPEQEDTLVYQTANIGVIGLDDNGYPLVLFLALGVDKDFSFSLVAYNKVQDKPLVARVTSAESQYWFSAAISEATGQKWSAQREADKAYMKDILEGA